MNLFFDLDGTLVDSSKGIIHSFQHAFKTMNLPEMNSQDIHPFIGPPLETTFASFYDSKDDIEKAIQAFRDYYEEKGVYENVIVYDGIRELLTQLKNKGHQLYVTTSKNEPMALVMLKELDLYDFFDGIYGALPHRFEKADVIFATLKEENLDTKETAIIGDTKYDMIGGSKAGIRAIGVTWGFGSEADLKNHGAKIIYHHPLELLNDH